MSVVGWIVKALVTRNLASTGWAHIIAWAVTILGALLLLWGSWSLLKATIIRNHDAEQAAELAAKARPADAKAADSRVTTTAIIANDTQETTHALAPLPDAGLTPRQRARACSIWLRQHPGAAKPAGC